MAKRSSMPTNKTVSTPVRNSPVPRVTQPTPAAAMPAKKKEITPEMIARRAYEIWQSGQGGTDQENWLRAERELRGA